MKKAYFSFDDNQGASVSKRLYEYGELRNTQQNYIEVGRQVSEWLMPGRGLYNIYSKPKSPTLVPTKVVNPKAKQALEVLVSFLKDGVCPSSRPWFTHKFRDPRAEQSAPLKMWANEVNEELSFRMREANFYSLVTTYFKEICGFGTGSMGVFQGRNMPLHFQPLTFGEYTIGTNSEGVVDRLYRSVFRNFYQLLDEFGDNIPKELMNKFVNRDSSLDMWYTVVEGIVPERFMDMPFTRFYILVGEDGTGYDGGVHVNLPKKNKYTDFLKVEGVNEFPYPTARFDVLAGEDYGVSPGMEAIPVIKRLQEVVKSNSIAYHKSIRPPLNVPVSMKNNVKTMPDGLNYYINPDEIITKAYDSRFDHRSADMSEGKLEQTLKEIFFNDIFLSTSRDPNASPLKARQVDEMSSDKYARLGPYVERLFYEGVNPILHRSVNILDRAGYLPDIPEEFKGYDLGRDIVLTSILAQSIKARAAIPMMNYLQRMGGVMQFAPEVKDIVNTDGFAYELADIDNIPPQLVNTPEQVKAIRENRAKMIAAKEAEAKQAQNAERASMMENQDADTTKTLSEAGANLSDNVETMGMI